MRLFTIDNCLEVHEGVCIETSTLSGGRVFTGAFLGELGRGRNRLYVPFIGKKTDGNTIKSGSVYFNKAGYPRISTDLSPSSTQNEAIVFFYAPIGFRGHNKLIPYSGVDIIGTGTIATGTAGKMACGDQWLLQLRDEAQARFIRTGRLYGEPSEYVITYREGSLTVIPSDISDMLDD